MKQIILLALIALNLSTHAQVKSLTGFFEQADEFIEEYVSDGRVDYQSIKKEIKDLNELVAFINKATTFSSPAVEKAFYINAYNILVIKAITDAYPVKGPMAIPGFFDKKTFVVNGRKMTLNFIENEVLRKKFPDARLHFALVCGAESCPPLPSYAILPEKIDRQLTDLTTQSIQNGNFTKIDRKGNKAEISMIFKWYEIDFITSNGSVKNFINKYLTNPLPPTINISHYEYDWSLNGR